MVLPPSIITIINTIAFVAKVLLYCSPLILAAIAKIFTETIYNNFRTKRARKVIDFLNEEKIKDYTKYYIPLHLLEKDFLTQEPQVVSKELQLSDFKTEIYGITTSRRFYLILGESGTGKTSLLVNLITDYYSQFKFYNNNNLRILKIKDDLPEKIDTISSEGNQHKTILLLDALDEYSNKESFPKLLDTIIEKCKDFKRVIITSRIQLFSSNVDIPKWSGSPNSEDDLAEYPYTILEIPPFTDRIVTKYLRKRYPLYNPTTFLKRRLAIKVVSMSPHLMLRPMILAHIGDLIDDENYQVRDLFEEILARFRNITISVFVKRKKIILAKDEIPRQLKSSLSVKTYKYTFQIYSKIVEKWIAREAAKFKKADKVNTIKGELQQFACVCAATKFNNYINTGKNHLDKTDIDLLVTNNEDLIGLFDQHEFQTRSLLTRNEEDQWNFAHQSIFEYILATIIVTSKFPHNFLLNFSSLDMCKQFIREECLSFYTLPFIASVIDNGNQIQMACDHNNTPLEDISFDQLIKTKIIGFNLPEDLMSEPFPETFYDFRVFVPFENLNYDTLVKIGNLYHDRHEVSAVYFFKKALEINETGWEARYGLAQVYSTLLLYDDAIPELKKAFEASHEPKMALELATFHFIMENENESLNAMMFAFIRLKLDENKKLVGDLNYHALGKYLVRIEQPDLALKYLQMCKPDGHRMFDYYNDIAIAHQQKENYVDAIDFFLKAYNEFNPSEIYSKGYNTLTNSYIIEMVYCYHKLGVSLSEVCNTIEPLHSIAYGKDAFMYYVSMSNIFFYSNNKEEGIGYLKMAEKVGSNKSKEWRLLGEQYYSLADDSVTAEAHFMQAIKLDQNEYFVLIKLGSIRLDDEKYPEARDYFEKALSLSKNDVVLQGEIYLNIGITFLFEDNIARARVYFLKSKKCDPDVPEVYNWLSYTVNYSNEKNYYLLKALQYKRGSYNYNFKLGIGYRICGKNKMARFFLDRAYKIRNESEVKEELDKLNAAEQTGEVGTG